MLNGKKISVFRKIGYIVFCGLSVLLSACSHQRTDIAPLTSIVPQLQVSSLWSKYAVAGTDDQYLRLQPVLQQRVIYVADALGRVRAINANNGKVLWKRSTRAAITSGVAVGDQGVFVGTASGNLLALNKQTGQWLWYQPTSASIVSAPLVSANKVFIKTEDDSVMGFQTKTGHVIWNTRAQGPDLVLRLGGAPALAQGKLVVAMANGQLAAFSASSGRQLWSVPLSTPKGVGDMQRMVDAVVTPKISRGVVYAANYQGNIAAISLKTGRILWRRALSTLTGLSLGGNAVYVTDVSGRVWSFNASTGAVNWQQKALVGRSLGSLAIMQNTLVVGDAEGYLHWLSLSDGHLMARVRMTNRAIIAAPLVQGNRVYATAINGRLYAYQVKPLIN